MSSNIYNQEGQKDGSLVTGLLYLPKEKKGSDLGQLRLEWSEADGGESNFLGRLYWLLPIFLPTVIPWFKALVYEAD